MKVKRSIVIPVVASIIVILVAYYVIYVPLNQNQNSGSGHSPISNNSGFQVALDREVQVTAGQRVNLSLDLGSYASISGISLCAFSNNTPACIYLESSGIFYDQIILGNERNACGAQSTFADPPYVDLYGGIWFLNMANVSLNGQIHIIVKFEPP